MRRLLKWALRIAVGLVVLALAAFGAGYWATRGHYSVAATVETDPALPNITIDGIKLHAETFGKPDRPVVVVLHGGPGGDYRALLPLQALADEYFVVFYDQRGSGLSARVSKGKMSLAGLVAELHGVVERYAEGRPVKLIGHSWGAMLATAYLGRYPDRVAHAVLAEPGMLTAAAFADLMAGTNNMQPPITLDVLWLLARIGLQALHVDGPDSDARADYFNQTLMMSGDIEGHPIAGYFCERSLATASLATWRFGARVSSTLIGSALDEQGRFRLNFIEGLERYARKVLLLAGDCNTLIGPAHQRNHHLQLFERADLVVIEGAGHTMFGEKPQASLDAIRRYFGADV